MTISTSVKRDLSQKPPLLPIIEENIPTLMRIKPRWLGWRWEPDYKAGKWNKPPIDLTKDRKGSSTDSTTWCDFETAKKAVDSGFVDGIGFALGRAESVHFSGVDFDNCRDRSTGIISPEILAYIHRLNTYGEVSPSGEGVKLVCTSRLPKGKRQSGSVEMYDAGRYFTITGHRLDGSAKEPSRDDKAISSLHAELIQSRQSKDRAKRETGLDDAALAKAALAGLRSTRANDYHEWLLVGMALHAVSIAMLPDWKGWSQQSAKYSADVWLIRKNLQHSNGRRCRGLAKGYWTCV